MLLFEASVIILLGFIYWSALAVIDRQTVETIEAEIRGLAEQYRNQGLGRLIRIIAERSGKEGDEDNVYLLTGPTLRPLAGNFDAWPKAGRSSGEWIELNLTREQDGVLTSHRIRARTFILPGGYRLLVGRDMGERMTLQAIILESLAWALAATLALGLAGGFVISRNMLQRVDAVSETSRQIVRGDFTRRVPTRGTGDEFDRLAGSLNDMLNQIEELMTGMRAVADSLGHDLRSPLTRLKGRAELALRDNLTVTTYRQVLEQIIAETDTILATFNALLSIAQAEARMSRSEMSVVDLSAHGRDIAELYEPLAEEKGLAFLSAIEDGVIIRGHAQLLAQAVANLLDNAIKYTPVGGAAGIAVNRVRGAHVQTWDTGPGIPGADRERVLDRFVRLDASRSTSGSGLGLSLVAAVAKLHGAALRLEDNAPGLKVTISFADGDLRSKGRAG
jgi:signal transduction histidine kinase